MRVGELDRIGNAEAREGRYTWFSGEPLFAYFIPISDEGGRFTALLQLSRHTGDFRTGLARLNRIGIIALGVLVVALSGIVLLGHRHAIGRPLAHLTATMTRIAPGEASQRAEPEGPRELQGLTHTFNTMMDRLQESGTEIERRRQREISLERRLEHSRRLAAVGGLAAGIAHELGTPLSVIDGRAQRLRRHHGDGPALVRDVDALREEVARIGHLVRGLQDFARRNPLRGNHFTMEHLIRSTLERLAPVLQSRGIQPEVDLPEPKLAVRADLHQLQQALGNLIRNAAQAATAGSPRLRIGAFPGEAGVRFTVEDNGPGLEPAIRDRVFEPFFTTKAVGEGMGLGLAVVHRVAEDHGGWVQASGGELGGARFELIIPNQPELEPEIDTETHANEL